MQTEDSVEWEEGRGSDGGNVGNKTLLLGAVFRGADEDERRMVVDEEEETIKERAKRERKQCLAVLPCDKVGRPFRENSSKFVEVQAMQGM
mmetsp:Transcript_74968/g.163656  ORF Transcript_74968/g.163656 Transcript_74968/m.163656 type:complete len:91 (+) Transcript_74968:134-406(+)